MFKGILIKKDDNGYRASLADIPESGLPEGNVTVAVSYSTLNYKDGLAITGKGPVVRKFPLVPGIDMAGEVTESAHPMYKPGDKVILNGWNVGEQHWGGLAQKIRLNGDWLIPLPEKLTPRQAMIIGTGGYTAMLCVIALEAHGIMPDKGPVLVTGANGGVGSFATSILSRLGYYVIASTGRPEESDYLTTDLGAAKIIHRDELNKPGRPLERERWAGAIDTVGGVTLANVCAATFNNGTVAACGLAESMEFPATVAPFILRGVTLVGINSVTKPYSERLNAWNRLAELVPRDLLEKIGMDITLSDVISTAEKLMEGKIRGRVVVDVKR